MTRPGSETMSKEGVFRSVKEFEAAMFPHAIQARDASESIQALRVRGWPKKHLPACVLAVGRTPNGTRSCPRMSRRRSLEAGLRREGWALCAGLRMLRRDSPLGVPRRSMSLGAGCRRQPQRQASPRIPGGAIRLSRLVSGSAQLAPPSRPSDREPTGRQATPKVLTPHTP